MTRCRAVWPTLVALMIIGGLFFTGSRPAAADEGGVNLSWTASLDGIDLRSVDSSRSVTLGADVERPFVLKVRNDGAQPVTIRSVRLEGRVMGMAFLSYTTRLAITLGPGEATERRFDMYFDDVSDQARGRIPGRLILLGSDRSAIADIAFPLRVHGSFFSIYSLFGMAVAGVTLVVLGGLLLAIRGGRLPDNRWRRARWFLPGGVGLGLTLTFSLSSLSLLTPGAGWWLSLVLVSAAGFFLLGYFWIRAADTEEEEEVEEEEVEEEVAVAQQNVSDGRVSAG